MSDLDRGAGSLRLFFSKLGFIHRRLWDRDGFYRGALLFGPVPLGGAAVAAGTWFMVHALAAPTVPLPDWAKLPQSADSWSASGETHAVPPAAPLPTVGANGSFSGYEPGWRAGIHPVEISPAFDADVKSTPLSAFLLEGTTIDLAPIIAAGPKDTRFVGTGSGSLVVRTPGTYALSLRFERPPGPVADCLTRLALGSRRIVSNLELANAGNMSKTFDAVSFNLQPGLYSIGWALGCWRDKQVVGPGRITVLMSGPGDQALEPVPPDDIIRTGIVPAMGQGLADPGTTR
jgi:hypothetical protein